MPAVGPLSQKHIFCKSTAVHVVRQATQQGLCADDLQADVSGTVVKWLVDNGSQITPGQVHLCLSQTSLTAVMVHCSIQQLMPACTHCV